MFRYLRREIAENNQRVISLEKCSLFLGYIRCLLQLVGLKRLTFNWDYAWKRGQQLQLFQITNDLQCQKHLWILGFCDINQNLEAQCVSFPALCLVDWEDLFFDALLCDVNFSCFSSQVFLPSYWNKANFDSQGEDNCESNCSYPELPKDTQIWEVENESVQGLTIRASGRPNLLPISCELATYFSLEITPQKVNFKDFFVFCSITLIFAPEFWKYTLI